jgi:hypothetical protein
MDFLEDISGLILRNPIRSAIVLAGFGYSREPHAEH